MNTHFTPAGGLSEVQLGQLAAAARDVDLELGIAAAGALGRQRADADHGYTDRVADHVARLPSRERRHDGERHAGASRAAGAAEWGRAERGKRKATRKSEGRGRKAYAEGGDAGNGPEPVIPPSALRQLKRRRPAQLLEQTTVPSAARASSPPPSPPPASPAPAAQPVAAAREGWWGALAQWWSSASAGPAAAPAAAPPATNRHRPPSYHRRVARRSDARAHDALDNTDDESHGAHGRGGSTVSPAQQREFFGIGAAAAPADGVTKRGRNTKDKRPRNRKAPKRHKGRMWHEGPLVGPSPPREAERSEQGQQRTPTGAARPRGPGSSKNHG